MLGESICDKKSIESKKKEMEGLGILPIITQIHPEKVLTQVKARHLFSDIEVRGYEIHHGRTKVNAGTKPLFEIFQSRDKKIRKHDGIMSQDKRCWGTYIHGVFDSDKFRRHFLNSLRRKKGWQDLSMGNSYDIDKEIDKLACLVRNNINIDELYKILWGRKRQ